MEGQNAALFCSYCGYCGAEIAVKKTWKTTRKRKRNVHINICQKPSIMYFCNRDCKLNWIFKRPNLKFKKDTNINLIKDKNKAQFDMAEIEDKTDEIEKYLKDNNLRILRKA